MKISTQCLPLMLVPAVVLLSACSGGGGGADGTSNGASPTVVDEPFDPAYPTTVDTSEGTAGDNTRATAGSIGIGDSQLRTLWPIGDIDYVRVNLAAGTLYEFSVNKLCVACDTHLYLYDAGGTELASNDDYIGLDSRIVYAPAADGTYYLKVEAYKGVNQPNGTADYKVDYGVSIYTLSVHEFTDNDGDGYSSHYDCDDTNNTIYPKADEIVGDGISQNCSGTDLLATTTPDAFEPDNDPLAAKPMFKTDIGLWEIQLQQSAWGQNIRTLHAAGEKDFFSFTLAPREGAYLNMHKGAWPAALLLTVYDSNGTTLLGTSSSDWPSHWVANTTTANKTFYVSYESADGMSTTWYVPALFSAGLDKDGDGYYNRDWGNVRDCNDYNTSIHPGATEAAGDGVDSNCDGLDDPVAVPVGPAI